MGVVTYVGPFSPAQLTLPDGSQATVLAGVNYTFADAVCTTLMNQEPAWWLPGDQHTANISPAYVVPALSASIHGTFSLMRTYGHSIPAGGGASGLDSCASTVIASYFGIPDTLNLAVGGAHLAWDSSDGQNAGISWIAQREKRFTKKAPYMAALDLAIVQFGYEDLTNGIVNSTTSNPVAQCQPIYQNGLRSALAIVRSSARFYAGDKTTNLDASITLGTPANWTAVANPANVAGTRLAPAYCGSVGFIGTLTNGAAGAFTIKIPGDYPGSSVCPLTILFYVNGLTAGTATASGASTGTFDLIQSVAAGTPANTPGTWDAVNARGNIVAWRFANTTIGQPGYIAPSNGTSQTLTITPASLAGGFYGMALCEWLIEAQTPPTIVVPQVDNFGNPGILVFQGIRNSDCVTMSQSIVSLVTSEFNDGTVLTPPYVLGQSGNTYGLNGTAGNAAAATVVSATGFGGTTSTNCQVTTATAWPASGAAMVGQEIYTWTGVSNSGGVATLSGVTRGAWNTTASTHAGNPLTDTLNVGSQPSNLLASSGSGISMLSADGTHPSDLGHATFAQTVITAIQSASADPRARARTVRARSRIYGIYRNSWNEQQIAAQGAGLGPTLTALKWDQTLVDSASIHPDVTNILQGSYDTIYLNASGLYVVSIAGLWTIGKSLNVAATSGTTGYFLLKNGVNLYPDQRSWNSADFPNAVFTIQHAATFPVFEAYNGDQIKVVAWQSGVGSSTTVSDNPLTSGATTINLAATAGMVAGDLLRIDDESITIGTVASGTQLTGCTRGGRGTTAAQHSSGASAFTGRGLLGAAGSTSPTMLTIYRLSPL